MQGELETKESLKRTLQRMLLDGARYIEFMQQLREDEKETFINLKRQWGVMVGKSVSRKDCKQHITKKPASLGGQFLLTKLFHKKPSIFPA